MCVSVCAHGRVLYIIPPVCHATFCHWSFCVRLIMHLWILTLNLWILNLNLNLNMYVCVTITCVWASKCVCVCVLGLPLSNRSIHLLMHSFVRNASIHVRQKRVVCVCVYACTCVPISYRYASILCQLPSWMVRWGYSTFPTPEPTSQRKLTFPLRISKARKSTWETRTTYVCIIHAAGASAPCELEGCKALQGNKWLKRQHSQLPWWEKVEK